MYGAFDTRGTRGKKREKDSANIADGGSMTPGGNAVLRRRRQTQGGEKAGEKRAKDTGVWFGKRIKPPGGEGKRETRGKKVTENPAMENRSARKHI